MYIYDSVYDTMKQLIIWMSVGCLLALTGCHDKGGNQDKTIEEDVAAKKMLQGIWLNDDMDDVAFQIKGDTIYYPDSTSQPTYFFVCADTLVMKGANEIKYPIAKLASHLFIFRNQNGDVVKLIKTSDKSYLKQFVHERVVALNQNTLVKRDTVVNYGDARYHLYVQVNPTTFKVYKSSYNDDGVEVDNAYYDNIVNLNVFNGAKKVFSRDFHKKDFESMLPASFYSQSILSDLVFAGVDDKGIQYYAVLAMPDTSISYQVAVLVSFSGKLTIKRVG